MQAPHLPNAGHTVLTVKRDQIEYDHLPLDKPVNLLLFVKKFHFFLNF
jgi:hypothetical protein